MLRRYGPFRTVPVLNRPRRADDHGHAEQDQGGSGDGQGGQRFAEQGPAQSGVPAALVALAADAGQSIEELRRTLRLTHPGTVRLVDRLVDQGWAERRRGAHGRAVAVVPTAAGRRTAAKIIAARQRTLIGLLDPLGDGQRRALAALLEVLLAASTADTEDLRRRCRLCDRRCCENCPVDLALDGR